MTVPKLLQGTPYDLSKYGFEWRRDYQAWEGVFSGTTLRVSIDLEHGAEVTVNDLETLDPLQGIYKHPFQVAGDINDLLIQKAEELEEEAAELRKAAEAISYFDKG